MSKAPCKVFFSLSTSKQMDVHIILFFVLCFDETTNKVKRLYLNSQFMGHATVSDVMGDFKKAHNGLQPCPALNEWAKCKLDIS